MRWVGCQNRWSAVELALPCTWFHACRRPFRRRADKKVLIAARYSRTCGIGGVRLPRPSVASVAPVLRHRALIGKPETDAVPGVRSTTPPGAAAGPAPESDWLNCKWDRSVAEEQILESRDAYPSRLPPFEANPSYTRKLDLNRARYQIPQRLAQSRLFHRTCDTARPASGIQSNIHIPLWSFG
jgi:hypothetical protein